MTYTRHYARAPGGTRVAQGVPLHAGANVPLVAALTPRGFRAAMTVDGALNTTILKTKLRTAAARTRQALDEALAQALNWISPTDAQNWFAHCGYHVS